MGSDAREAAINALVEDSDAIPDTIEIVREKYQDREAVVAATFRRPSGRLVRGFVGLFTRDETSVGVRAVGGNRDRATFLLRRSGSLRVVGARLGARGVRPPKGAILYRSCPLGVSPEAG